MSRHTPGPWVKQWYRIYGPPDPRSKHGNGRALIGGVGDDAIDWRAAQLEVDGRGAFHAESMANLSLMAASPELARVVQAGLQLLTVGACEGCGAEPGTDIDCALCRWVTEAEDALREAGLR